MKLVKLSLAAIVAAGAMTTFASAQPLEDAIKGVEVSGMARYRYYNQSDLRYSADNGKERNRFSGLLNLTSPVADNLKFGISLATDTNNYGHNSASSAGSFNVNKFWFQYAVDGLSIKAGKIEVPTPWTQAGFTGTRGNGVLATYSGLENWTFAGAYYLQTNAMNSVLVPSYNKTSKAWTVGGQKDLDAALGLGQEDLMALGAIGKVGPVGLQVWAARMTNAIDYTVFGEASFMLDGFNIKGQLNYLKLAEELRGNFKDKSGLFYGVEGGYKNDQFFVDLGYTSTDKDMPMYVLDGDNDGFIKFGQQLYYLTQNNPGTQVFFGKAGFNWDKFGFEAGYGYADVKAKKSDKDEFYGKVSYKYAKNFGLELYYSVLSSDIDAEENNEIRFQALYNF